MGANQTRGLALAAMWICTGLAVAVSAYSSRISLLVLGAGAFPTFALVRSPSYLERALAWTNLAAGYILFAVLAYWALESGTDSAAFAGAGIR